MPAENQKAPNQQPLRHKSDLIAKIKYSNTLPKIPFDPKLVEIQTEVEK